MSREVQAGTLSILFLSLMVGCGGERRSGAAPGDTAQAPAADTAAPSAADTVAAPTVDTTASHRDTTPKAPAPSAAQPAVAQQKPVPKPKPAAPKPAAPKPADSTPPAAVAPKPADSTPPTPAAPAQSADAPLRDPYHQAPLDTVAQVVYDGWKQFNLNCARCHGEDVQGTTIAPHLILSLRPDGPINTKEIFMQTVCAGRPAKGMPSWCALGMDMGKIESIYSYVKGRSDGKIHPGRPAVKPAG
jgi:hypothetical protein